MTSVLTSSLADELATRAAQTVSNITETNYVHDIYIDESAGIFLCDCSGYLEYLLSQVALRHLAPIRAAAKSRGASRPLAKDFFAFFAAQSSIVSDSINIGGSPGWNKIPAVMGARRGDMLAWRLTNAKDTGHVVLLAATPVPVVDATAPGPCFALRVYDSSEYIHFEDSRAGPDGVVTGVGESTIHVDVDSDGSPVGFRFSGRANHQVNDWMVIARLKRFEGREGRI